MLAAKSEKADMVTSLLEFDAKVEDRDVTGNSAADYANGKKKVRKAKYKKSTLKFIFKILDCLKRFDKSQEPVTSFPSKIEMIPEIPLDTEGEDFGLPVAAGYDPGMAEDIPQKEELPVSDLSTWDDSVPSSPHQEQHMIKSKVNHK